MSGARPGADARLHRDPHAAGARKAKGGSPAIALGRSRGGFSTKLHIRADGRGLPLAFVLTGGERHDLTAVPELLDGMPLARRLIVADRSYDADRLRSHLLMHGACARRLAGHPGTAAPPRADQPR